MKMVYSSSENTECYEVRHYIPDGRITVTPNIGNTVCEEPSVGILQLRVRANCKSTTIADICCISKGHREKTTESNQGMMTSNTFAAFILFVICCRGHKYPKSTWMTQR